MAPRMQCLVGIHNYYLVDLFCLSSAVAWRTSPWWKAGLQSSYMTTLGHAPLQEGKMSPCVEVLHWSVCKGLLHILSHFLRTPLALFVVFLFVEGVVCSALFALSCIDYEVCSGLEQVLSRSDVGLRENLNIATHLFHFFHYFNFFAFYHFCLLSVINCLPFVNHIDMPSKYIYFCL